ncbi:MAG: hypothetical protein ABSE62_04155 [Chthoniobacteraceae bacterium]
MKSTTRVVIASAIGLITAVGGVQAASTRDESSSSPRQETTMEKFENGTRHLTRESWRDSKRIASDTWMESKRIARTTVHSPAIVYEAARGERPLFGPAPGDREVHQQMALTGHPVNTSGRNPPNSNSPPI